MTVSLKVTLADENRNFLSLKTRNTISILQGVPYVLERFPEAVAPLILIFKKKSILYS